MRYRPCQSAIHGRPGRDPPGGVSNLGDENPGQIGPAIAQPGAISAGYGVIRGSSNAAGKFLNISLKNSALKCIHKILQKKKSLLPMQSFILLLQVFFLHSNTNNKDIKILD